MTKDKSSDKSDKAAKKAADAPAEPSSINARPDEPKPGWDKTFEVSCIAGPGAAKFPEPLVVENCCDEAEAIRLACQHHTLDSPKHRFHVVRTGVDETAVVDPIPVTVVD